jgi:hypothetical protein
MLKNNTRDIPNLVGYHTNISYGDYYSGTAYYTGGKTAKMWVKEQRLISAPGKLYTLLVLEGFWGFFREQLVIGDLESSLVKHYYDQTDTDTSALTNLTIFGILYELAEQVYTQCGIDLILYMHYSQNDLIINDYIPGQELNVIPYESIADLVIQLMGFTKCFIRIDNTDTMEIRYPQDSDAVDHTYYSNQQHYFYDFTSNDSVLVPNHIVVLAGQLIEDAPPLFAGDWPSYENIIVAEEEDATAIAEYMRVTSLHIAGYIQQQSDAEDRAGAILYKTEKQQVTGQLVIPHDASVELYDKVEIDDFRGM